MYNRFKLLIYASAFLFLTLFILGCGPKVLIPPEVDLIKYGPVGLVTFKSTAKGKLADYITLKFLDEISGSQKGIKIVELGDEKKVLNSVDRQTMDPNVIQMLGKKYNLKSIITGDLNVSDIKPKVNISSIITSMSVKAEVQATLIVRLIETKDGATIWTNLAEDRRSVASVSIFSKNDIMFDAQNPDDAYGDLAQFLVKAVTEDLKPRKRRM
ncbi:MAG: hypothetical protein AAB116_10255 [Candidatus Poribacteria bacterium]